MKRNVLACKKQNNVTIQDSCVNSVTDFKTLKLVDISVDSENLFYVSDENGVLYNKDKTVLVQYPGGNKRLFYAVRHGVEIISAYAFHEAENLVEIRLFDGIKYIADYCFSSCKSLETILIPDSVVNIGEGAFVSCKKLHTVIMPSNIQTISKYAFGDCTSIESVMIPDSVTSIDEGAFWGCTELKKVYIPDTVRSIGRNAFRDCTGLREVYFLGNYESFSKLDIDLGNDWCRKAIKVNGLK